MLKNLRTASVMLASCVFGVVVSFCPFPGLSEVAHFVIDVFMRLLKFIALPMIFLSIISAIGSVGGKKEVKSLIGRTAMYTIGTTVCAGLIAMLLYRMFTPVYKAGGEAASSIKGKGIASYLLNIIPENVFQMFVEHNVMAIVFAALMLGLATLGLSDEKRQKVADSFSLIFDLFMTIAGAIVKYVPYFLWTFVVCVIEDIKSGVSLGAIVNYLCIVCAANIFQAVIVLPLLLKIKGYSPGKAFKGMLPALMTGFFSKSSSATMPATMHCVEKNLGVDSKIVRVTIPLCTTINMNACAGFIYITFMFVAESNGLAFNWLDSILWVVLATLAAVGNAGVPMGCFFMTTAYLVGMGIPTHMMSLILPFYGLIDMFETAVNIWSDACVSVAVNSDQSRTRT